MGALVALGMLGLIALSAGSSRSTRARSTSTARRPGSSARAPSALDRELIRWARSHYMPHEGQPQLSDQRLHELAMNELIGLIDQLENAPLEAEAARLEREGFRSIAGFLRDAIVSRGGA